MVTMVGYWNARIKIRKREFVPNRIRTRGIFHQVIASLNILLAYVTIS
jgi:hypothetical protein